MNEKRIAVSKLSANYDCWIKRIDARAETVDLYPMETDEAIEITRRSSGLLLTGGSDIHPSRYSREDYLHHCRNIDEKRDELELLLIRVAFDEGIPVLGICRGLQVLNVATGGTLIPDIPEFIQSNVAHAGEEDVFHKLKIRENTGLFAITNSMEGIVNSSHHQCIDILADGFQAVAFSPDGIVEAIEADKALHPFCIAVQWHPERMEFTSTLSWKVGLKFLEYKR